MERYPKDKWFRQGLAQQYRNNNLLSKAIDEVNESLKLDPNFGSAYNQLGYTYMQMKNFEKAVDAFQQYAKVSPGDINPIDSMAECYIRLGKLDDAIKSHETILAINPDNTVSYSLISFLYSLKNSL